MVAGGGNAPALEDQGQLLGQPPVADVDDARARHALQDLDHLILLRPRVADDVVQIIPPETLLVNEFVLAEGEVFLNVPDYLRRRRGGNGDAGDAGEEFPDLGDPEVGRAEVVAPLADAVRLVHGQQRHVHLGDADAGQFGLQPLGAQVEELSVAVNGVVEDAVDVVSP